MSENCRKMTSSDGYKITETDYADKDWIEDRREGRFFEGIGIACAFGFVAYTLAYAVFWWLLSG